MKKFKRSPAHFAGNLETFTMRIDPEYLHKLRAMAATKRDLSQREIVERALDLYFAKHADQLEKAEALYKEME